MKSTNLGRELEWAAAAAAAIDQPLHASVLERCHDQIERGARVAVMFGRCGCTEPIDDVGAQHLVLHLDLVVRQEEGHVAIEQGGGHRVGAG